MMSSKKLMLSNLLKDEIFLKWLTLKNARKKRGLSVFYVVMHRVKSKCVRLARASGQKSSP